MTMTSNKPYLIRAIYDWVVDNNMTPYILVNAEYPGVQVPQEHVHGGKIVLNISPLACRGLHLENDRIVFTARFSGIVIQIFVVPAAVLAIYAKENGRGMEFGDEYNEPTPPPTTQPPKTKLRPALTLVKKED
ncbi:ClpXP protease specificity-enhancing factor [Legionella dresdenensis]|uniref:ClpXP protease specificity-enhancing factor n=1 Tax=Legionella dresdenensis TaxID=450200 RepID=A0ABV8CFP9_9GAMM